MKKEEYPEEATMSDLEEFEEFVTFNQDDGDFKNAYEEAKLFALTHDAQHYTQVDADNKPDYILYVRGFAFVNRTGFYVVVK